MANVKLSYATAVNLTITNANLASSATAGWQSQGIDNTSNLYIDALVQVKLNAVNTAPANNQAIYIFAFGVADGSTTDYSGTGAANASGSEGTITFPSVGSNNVTSPLIGFIPYTTQNAAIVAPPFSFAAGYGGKLPAKYSIGMINFSGMTLSVASIKIVPVFYTVA